MSLPHDSWAEAYDELYEKSFGFFYQRLTKKSIDIITRYTTPQARIVDFGAGTGRLSIPLSKSGRYVTAVEPSMPMLDVLRSKANGLNIELVHSTMADFKAEKPFEFATCVFTVLLYLLDEDHLSRSFSAVANALMPEGLLLLDIPSKALFHSFETSGDDFERSVQITSVGDRLYVYEENSILLDQTGQRQEFSDKFKIRHWPESDIFNVAERFGLTVLEDLSEDFSGSGSKYFLFRKI